jgi:hypothetical protein
MYNVQCTVQLKDGVLGGELVNPSEQEQRDNENPCFWTSNYIMTQSIQTITVNTSKASKIKNKRRGEPH